MQTVQYNRSVAGSICRYLYASSRYRYSNRRCIYMQGVRGVLANRLALHMPRYRHGKNEIQICFLSLELKGRVSLKNNFQLEYNLLATMRMGKISKLEQTFPMIFYPTSNSEGLRTHPSTKKNSQ